MPLAMRLEAALEEFTGYVENIVFRNEENGYTVLEITKGEKQKTCVGNFSSIAQGDYLWVSGSEQKHPVYGKQLKIEAYEQRVPEDKAAMEKYLGSGSIKGVGPALAARMVKLFGEDTFRIIETEPERLSEVRGISDRLARQIALQFEEKRNLRQGMLYLQQYGISNALSVKIMKYYGAKASQIIEENPYKLAEDIPGVGFRAADEIAMRAGRTLHSELRIKAAILYCMQQASSGGHIYLPKEKLFQSLSELLGGSLEELPLENYLTDMVLEQKLVFREQKEVYLSSLYYMELNCARMLLDLNRNYPMQKGKLERIVAEIEEKESIVLDELQRKAVMQAQKHGLLVITGGPGTGKTTTINTLLQLFEREGLDILLAAPTGRAAKRMADTTGYEASTLHRLLEVAGIPEGDERGRSRFERNEENPLETDVIIVDEMSMVDIYLLYALLRAVPVGTRLVLVGDMDQLPSVGPGNVLHDLIESGCCPVVRLEHIFRQAQESGITVNAHKINRGELLNFDNKSRDFFMVPRPGVKEIIAAMYTIVTKKLPSYVGVSPYEIQVLTPMRKGDLGIVRLNQVLQEILNPPGKEKREKEFHETLFREGDKVMQMKNDYRLEWEVRGSYGAVGENGCGIFNGDCGIIREINEFAQYFVIEFDENRRVEYPYSCLDELELAYAVTVHKSQGSEYPVVVLPILSGPRMLMNRNLLYTAVTRAKSCVVIVGSEGMVQEMIGNISEQKRYSTLGKRLQELSGTITKNLSYL